MDTDTLYVVLVYVGDVAMLTMEMLDMKKPEAIPTVRSARLIFVIVVSILVCNYVPVPNWLQLVFRP